MYWTNLVSRVKFLQLGQGLGWADNRPMAPRFAGLACARIRRLTKWRTTVTHRSITTLALASTLLSALFASSVWAKDEPLPQTLITNVQIFDGVSDKLTPGSVLKAATSTAGGLLTMTKLTNYHDGRLGVIEQGAYADILLVDGNPLEDITVNGGNELWLKAPKPTPIETLRLIMKDGVIYKNTLGE
jgi:hypothetical protein